MDIVSKQCFFFYKCRITCARQEMFVFPKSFMMEGVCDTWMKFLVHIYARFFECIVIWTVFKLVFFLHPYALLLLSWFYLWEVAFEPVRGVWEILFFVILWFILSAGCFDVLIIIVFAGTTGIVDYTNYDDMKYAVSIYLLWFYLFTSTSWITSHELCIFSSLIVGISLYYRSRSLMTLSSGMHFPRVMFEYGMDLTFCILYF